MRASLDHSDLGGFFVIGRAHDAGGTPPLVAADSVVDDLCSIAERTEAVTLDDGVMGEDILPFRPDEEPIALSWIEPLDSPRNPLKLARLLV